MMDVITQYLKSVVVIIVAGFLLAGYFASVSRPSV